MATLLELYERLKPKLGQEEARSLLEYIESTVERRAATKEDLGRVEMSLREEIQRVEVELHDEIKRVEGELRGEIQRVEMELREEIQRVRADLIRWTFAFWVGTVAVLTGIMFGLFRAFLS